jgi:hypothetical protein
MRVDIESVNTDTSETSLTCTCVCRARVYECTYLWIYFVAHVLQIPKVAFSRWYTRTEDTWSATCVSSCARTGHRSGPRKHDMHQAHTNMD